MKEDCVDLLGVAGLICFALAFAAFLVVVFIPLVYKWHNAFAAWLG